MEVMRIFRHYNAFYIKKCKHANGVNTAIQRVAMAH